MSKNKFIRTAFTVSADGLASQEQITIHLDADGESFNCVLPKYVADRVAMGETKIWQPSLRGVVEAYESAMEQYQRWRLKAKASPMIMLMVEGEVEVDVDPPQKHTLGRISLWAEHVYVSDPVDGFNVYLRTGTTDNVLDFGDMGEKIEPPPTVVAYLPDNREVRQKIKQLTGSIETARLIIESLRGLTADQLLTRFMNIGEPDSEVKRQPEVNPAQQSLPLDDDQEEL